MANGMIPDDILNGIRKGTEEELGTPEERKATREKLNAARDAFFAKNRGVTNEQRAKLDAARKLMQEGIQGEQDILSRLMPTMAKSARGDIRRAKAMRESVPMSARENEAYEQAGYKKGGKVKKYAAGGSVAASRRADGVAQRGKTKGRIC